MEGKIGRHYGGGLLFREAVFWQNATISSIKTIPSMAMRKASRAFVYPPVASAIAAGL